MSDLINGREMLKRYQVDLCYGIACKECSMCTEDGGCRVEEWIDKYPSAETEIEIIRAEAYVKGIDSERKRISDWCRPQGEWIEQEDCWQCSECGDEFVLDVDVKPIDARMYYCPNCGARMLAKDTNVPNKKGADDETD